MIKGKACRAGLWCERLQTAGDWGALRGNHRNRGHDSQEFSDRKGLLGCSMNPDSTGEDGDFPKQTWTHVPQLLLSKLFTAPPAVLWF